jgi:tRNA nucleotidyltransferase (CCA-adding enzyme)
MVKQMKITKLPQEFEQAKPVMEKIEAAGYDAYFVGGSVRDTILGHPIHDVDIATSAFPAEIKELFPRTIDLGIEHGTVLVLWGEEQYEITTFRTEEAYQDFRRPDKVSFVRSLSEDLKRRDFTINAFALNKEGEVIDLFDGLEDLQTQTLRAVGQPQERFHEDALRMMRGLRFVSQLGFELEPRTFAAIYDNHQLLAKISVERITIEFVKLLLGKYRNLALKAFVATECYLYCPGLKQSGEALLRMADLPEHPLTNETSAWVLLIDQLGLPKEQIRSFLKQWKCSNEQIRMVQAVSQGLLQRKQGPFSDEQLYHLGSEVIALSEALLSYYGQEIDGSLSQARYQELPIHSLKDLAVNGRDLLQQFGQSGGPWLKEVLTALEKAVVTKTLMNEREALLHFAKKLLDTQEEEK